MDIDAWLERFSENVRTRFNGGKGVDTSVLDALASCARLAFSEGAESSGLAAAFARGREMPDQESLTTHVAAVESLKLLGGNPADETQYLAALAAVEGTTPPPAPEFDPLAQRLVTADALDRLTMDELPPDYDGEAYIQAFGRAEERAGMRYGAGLDFYEEADLS
jgi:hypothetical protein